LGRQTLCGFNINIYYAWSIGLCCGVSGEVDLHRVQILLNHEHMTSAFFLNL